MDERERHDGAEVGKGRVGKGDFAEGFEEGEGDDGEDALSERDEEPGGKGERGERVFERDLEEDGET